MKPNSKGLEGNASSHKSRPATRRQFLQTAAGAALAVAGSAVASRANNHPHPSPQSLTYLDRRMYLHNMEVIAHILPGEDRGGKMQMMTAGDRRYLVQQGDFIDVSNLRKPAMYNPRGWNGYQVQVAWNQKLKKWILVTSAAAPITSSTPTAPNGKYDDPKLLDKWRNYKGLRGIRVYDVSNPAKTSLLSEFSTGATGAGTHRNYYDGGRYAYLDTAPDDSFIHQISYFRPLVNGNMIVDMSDPANPKEVSMWWVPGSRKGEEAEYEKWQWSK
ncbi:MAG TPA: twin-arginine translocation signal domain-containing protein, partial [Terriglobales bacterium]|nr:twin-arginine translocation signal domain-containing protein [Terriglobales bacterium]